MLCPAFISSALLHELSSSDLEASKMLTMADLLIDAGSLHTTVIGVGAATKAPEQYLLSISAWLDALKPATRTVDQWLAAGLPDESRPIVQISLSICLLRQAARLNHQLSADELDYIWSGIHDAVLSSAALQFPVTRSSQGFLVVSLCSLIADGRIRELWRFHLWLPDGKRGCSAVGIHAHQTLGHSWTLTGEGTDIRFRAGQVTSQAQATHAKYEPVWTDANNTSRAYKTNILSSTVRNTGELLHVEETSKTTYTKDQAYIVPAGEYHRSLIAGNHIHATLFVFDAARGYEHDAAVLGPPDGEQFTELRDSTGITAIQLVRIAKALRQADSSGNADPELMQAYARYFLGDDPALAAPIFARRPSPQHRRYLEDLIARGLDLDIADAHGLTVLDHALAGGDQELQGLIINALRWKLTPDEIEQRLFESEAHKIHQDLYQTVIRPHLSSDSTFVAMREEYAATLAERACVTFDGLRFAWYSDFVRFPRMPRLTDGIAHSTQDKNPGHIVYLAYRWLHKDPMTGKTANDDAEHTQYRRMIEAIKQYLLLHPEVNTGELGIWLDSVCVDRKNPLPGIAALPLNLAQCETLITIEDDLFWTRAWCTVEAFIIQKLRRSFDRHSWYRFADGRLALAPIDMAIDTSATTMTWERDRRIITFLQRQAESF